MRKKFAKLLMIIMLMILPLVVTITNTQATSRSVLSVSTELSDSPSTRIFKVYNPTSTQMSYDFYIKGDKETSGQASIGAHQTNTHEVQAGNGSIVFTLVDSNNALSSGVQSLSAYNIKVYYRYNGKDIKNMTYSSCSSSKAASITAPKTISANGRVYDILNGNYKEASYGTEKVVFEYTLRQRDAYQSKVVFLDQDGNTIKTAEKFNVTEKDGGSYTAPQSITFNSRTYKVIANQVTNIQQDYNTGSQTYYVRYQLQESDSQLPYYITIDYKAGNTLLTRRTMTVQSGKTVTFEAPVSYKANTATYQVSGQRNISHQYGDATRNYTVQYEKVMTDSNQPYDVYVNYIDVATGKTLETHSKTVDVDKTVKFNVPGSVKVDGINYILSANQPSTVTHKFGTSQTQYNIYFHEKDLNIQEYPVTVSYYDLTSNKIIYTTKMTVKADEKLSIRVPAQYLADGQDYVLLSGQDTENTHDFYSTRRSYTFIYRDADDLANQSVVVIPGETTNVVETPTGGTVTIDNATGRTVITVPDQQTPLVVDGDGNLVPEENTNNPDIETVDDDETPLAQGKNQNQTPIIVEGSIAGLGIVAFVIFFMMKKRKKAKQQ